MNTDNMNHVLFGAAGETFIHPAVLTALVTAVILILVLRRRYVLIPLLTLSLLCPVGQTLMLGSFHFQVYRILILFVWIRMLCEKCRAKKDVYSALTAIDKAILVYTLSCIACYTLLWQQSAAFFAELGKAYNILGFYFALRFFIRDWADVERLIRVLAVISVVIAAVMFNEQITGTNVLGVFGGVPEHTAVREGYLR